MNKKKWLSALAILTFTLFSLPNDILAENDGDWCSNVKVIGSGATSTAKSILLIHNRTDCGAEWPPNTRRWFQLDDSQSNGNAMLAAAMTAQTTGKTVMVVGLNRLFTDQNKLVQVTVH